jgi:serine/threonine-protein kinase RsbW
VLEGYAAPIVDDEGLYHGRVWYLHDETERRATSVRLAAAERAQRFLLDASAVITRASGYAETLRSLAGVAVPVLGDLCLIDVVEERGRLARIASMHAEPGLQSLADELAGYPPDPAGAHPSAQTIRDGRSRFSGEMSDEFLAATAHDERHLSILRRLGFTSYMTVPLLAEDEVLGAVTMVSAGSGRRFGPDDLALVEDLAVRAAAVVVKERRSDSQRRLSHSLQADLLPADPPKLSGVQVAVRYLPGTGDVEVGGDFWDIAELADGTVGLAVGDVEGHDMTAAAAMVQLRSVIRALRAQSSGPDELISLIHDAWDQLDTERMVTACFVRLYPASGTLRVGLAGHPPPLLIERPGHAAYLDAEPGPPLGTIPVIPAMAESAWPPGAVLVMFTDGLVEGQDTPITHGLRRLIEAALGGDRPGTRSPGRPHPRNRRGR